MVKINFLNENGNVSVKVRADVKAQAKVALKAKLGNNVIENENGGFSVQIAEDTATGSPVYANYDVIISDTLPKKAEKSKSKTATAKAEDVIPELFSDVEPEIVAEPEIVEETV